MHYLLFYEVGEDYISRRVQFREAHLRKTWKASERGELVLGGALANPVDGAVLLFSGHSPDVAKKFARDDPYVTSGLVKRWHVREWSTVVGVDAASPLCSQAAEATVKEGLGSRAKPVPIPPGSGMILRMWKARSTVEKAGEYIQHATKKIFPKLRTIEGHRGTYLLRRMLDGTIELVVLTLWDSMTAVRRFAGAEPEKAVVEPEAQAILASFDEHVTHFEVVEH